MIYNSRYWKNKLLVLYQKYTKSLKYINFENKEDFVEYYCFESAFIIRKLIDSNKLSNYCDSRAIGVNRYLIQDSKNVTIFNRDRVEKLYDFSKYNREDKKVRDICNSLIHSFCFTVLWDENFRESFKFLVSSDHDKDKYIYEVSFENWDAIVWEVITDDICSTSWEKPEKNYNDKKNGYKCKKGTTKEFPDF